MKHTYHKEMQIKIKSPPRGATLLVIILTISLCFSGIAYAAGADDLSISKDGKLNVNINDTPLSEVLRNLSRQLSIEIKGSPVSNEPVKLTLSNVSLEETLKRLMRGYNYVLIRPENSQKSVLMVLGKAERTKYTDPPPRVAAVAPTPNIPAVPPQQQMVNPPGANPTMTNRQAARINQPRPGSGQQAISTPPGSQTPGGTPGSADPYMPPSPTMMGGATIHPDLMPPMPPGMAGLPAARRGQTGAGQQTVSDIPPQIPVIPGASASPVASQQTVVGGFMPPGIPSDTSQPPAAQAPPQTQKPPAKEDITDLRPPSMPLN